MQAFKKIVPDYFWYVLRKIKILKTHKSVANQMRVLVDFNDNNLRPLLQSAANINGTKKIIWQYWAQGFEYHNLPELVRICLASVDKYASDYTIIRLSDENIADYIDFPEYIYEKRKHFSIAHFSDLLRVALLSVYGGLWLDATILLTGPLPMYLSEKDFFMYQRSNEEPHKKYWERYSYAYYFGWYKGFRVNLLNSVIYAKSSSKVVTDLYMMLLHFWKTEKQVPDYFFFQILFDVYMEKHPERNCSIVSDCIPNLLQQVFNGYPYLSIDEVLEKTKIHKLSYKNPNLLVKLKLLIQRHNLL